MEKSTKEKQAKALEKHLPKIQAWMDDNVKGENNKGTPGKDVFQALKDDLGLTMQENSFCVGLSLNVKLGNIKGFVGRQGPAGGYFPEKALVEIKDKQKNKTSKQVKNSPVNKVDLGNGMYLASGSDGSWSFVKPSGPRVKSSSLKKTLSKVAALLAEADDPGLEVVSKISNSIDGSETNLVEKLKSIISGV